MIVSLRISPTQMANLDQISLVPSFERGIGYNRFLGISCQNLGFHSNQKVDRHIMGKNCPDDRDFIFD